MSLIAVLFSGSSFYAINFVYSLEPKNSMYSTCYALVMHDLKFSRFVIRFDSINVSPSSNISYTQTSGLIYCSFIRFFQL